MLNENIKTRFIELRESVNQSSEHTKRQIESVDSYSYLGGLISIIATLSISYILNIFIYWIPAGFLLLYLWSLKGFKNVIIPFKQEKVDATLEMYEKVEKNQIIHRAECFFRNLNPFINSVAIIYAISIFIILAINSGWVLVNEKFNIIIPLLTCILYVITPFTVDSLVDFFRKGRFMKIISNLGNMEQKRSKGFTLLIFLFGLFLAIAYIILAIVFPLISIIITYNLIKDWLFFSLVLILQVVIVLFLLHFFTAQSAKKELINSLTNFSDVNYQINSVLLNNFTNEDEFERLKIMYLTAKQFDLKIDDSFKFINLYMLLIHRVYIKAIPEVEKYHKKKKAEYTKTSNNINGNKNNQ